MDNDKRQVLIGQVWQYTRVITILSGIALSAFTFTGYVFMISDVLTFGPRSSNEKNYVSSIKSDQLKVSDEPGDQIRSVNFPIAKQAVKFENAQIKQTTSVEKKQPKNKIITPVPGEIDKIPTVKISLANFAAECNNGNISVSWITEGNEKDLYKLESSIDSKNFEAILSSPLATRNENGNLYQLTIPVSEEANRFFRLKKKGENGKLEYSEVLEAHCIQNNSPDVDIDVFPAGYGTYKVVVYARVEDHMKIVMTDLNEIELVSDEFDVEIGHNEYIFKSGDMPRGNYNLKVTNGSVLSQKRVAIK